MRRATQVQHAQAFKIRKPIQQKSPSSGTRPTGDRVGVLGKEEGVDEAPSHRSHGSDCRSAVDGVKDFMSRARCIAATSG